MNILNVEHVSLDLGERMLFTDISFGLEDHDKAGLVGVNGCGKSTLLKMIAGERDDYTGSIILSNSVRTGYLPQKPDFEGEEDILTWVTGDEKTGSQWSTETDAKIILADLGITDVTASLSSLSGGQKKRVALARTLLVPSDLLLLDEPTNHLDSEMIEWLENYLKSYKGAMLMVTHDRYFLDSVTDRILEMDRSRMYSYETNYSGYLELKEQRLENEDATWDKSRNLYRNELKWVRRGAKARSTKQKARLSRFEELKTMVRPERIGSVELTSIVSRMGKKTIELHDISKTFGERTVISDFSYIFQKDRNVGIVGKNGCGKSTLLNIITGKLKPDSGSVEVGDTIRIGYFPQTSTDMPEDERVIDYVKDIAEYLKTPDGNITASAMCERFLFDKVMQYAQIGRLSGGERRRLHLLRILMSAPNVLILDEPTNDLDIDTLNVLADYLDHFNGILIVVSHDRYFLDRTVDRVLAFEEGGRIVQYEGGYTDWYLKTHENVTVTDGKNMSSSKSGESSGLRKSGESRQQEYKTEKQASRKLKFSYSEKKEYESLEGDIEAAEAKLENLEAEMEKSATDFVRLNELTEQKSELESEIDHMYERWEYLSDLDEKIRAQKQ